MIPIFASLPESSQTKAVMEYLYELGNRREWNELEKVLHEILSCNGFHKSVFGNFSFYSYKKACGQKRTVRGSKNSRRLSNDTPAI